MMDAIRPISPEFAPGIFDGIEDVRVGVEDGGGTAAQELPRHFLLD
jgi:hypothetical protein